jgi:ADP-ribosyl-[dinitrogen reductase] hydrolase
MTASLASKSRGCLLGLAAGNLLGLPNEFACAPADPPVTGIDPAELRAPWDDDLAQAFELGESLARHRRADPRDLAARFTRWFESNGRGCGTQTRKVIEFFRKGFSPLDASRQVWELSGCNAAGNGSVMRCAPVALAFHDDPAALAAAALESAAVTHFDPRCTQSALAVCAGAAALLHDQPALPAALAALRALPRPEPDLIRALESVPRLSLGQLPLRGPAIGYCVTCAQAGLWAAGRPEDLETTLLAIVNEGGDADTNGAVAGALLGARFGEEAIPKRWLERIRDRGKLEVLAEALIVRAGG